MHCAAVATVNDNDSYDNDDGVASVWHQDPPQAAQFKNGGHKWEGGRTPRKKARGGEASPISRPDHERAHAVASAKIDAMDEYDLGDEDNTLGDDDDDNADDSSTTPTTTLPTTTPTTSRASGGGLKGVAEATQLTRPVAGAKR